MIRFFILLILLSMLNTSFAQSNLLLLNDEDVSYYMNSNADSVILHLVFDTVYIKSRGKDSISQDLSLRNNTLTSNFKLRDNSSGYSPFSSKGTSLYFNGINNKLIRDTAITFDADFRMGMRSFTIEAIIKTTSNGQELERNYWLCKHTSISPFNGWFHTTTANEGSHYIKLQDDENSLSGGRTSNTRINDGKWYYVVSVINRPDKNVTVYVNGNSGMHQPLDNLSSIKNFNAPKAYFTVGGLDNTRPGWYLGYIYEIRITKKALSESEIISHWNKIRTTKNVCPIPTTFTVSSLDDHIEVSSREKGVDSTFWYRGISLDPIILWKTVSGDSSVTDFIEAGITYYYRARNLRYMMNGERILSDYSNNVSVRVNDAREERIKLNIDRTFEPLNIYSSNFGINTEGFTSIYGTFTGNVDGKWGRNDVLVSIAGANSIYAYKTNVLVIGFRYKGTLDYYVPNASTIQYIKLMDGLTTNFFSQTVIENHWTKATGSLTATNSQLRIYTGNANNGDSCYFHNIQVSQISNWMPNGNHSLDTSSAHKYEGNYCMKVTSTGAGDATANYISLDTTKFRELKPDSVNTFSIRARTSTSDVIMYVNIGGQTQSYALTDTLTKYEMNFTATANEVKKPIKIWFNKAVPEVNLDTASLR